MAPIKNHVIFLKCNNVTENIQIHMSQQLFFFWIWNFSQIWKINMKKEYIEIHVATFPYWIWFGNNF
jgi:hypothetical protein